MIYDALGRAVDVGGHELVHGPGGGIMAEMTGQTAVNEYVPPPGGGAAVFQGTTLAYYRHVDWQRSAGLATTPSRTLYSATQFAAFGQLFNATSTAPDPSFTSQPPLYGTDTYNFPMPNLSPIQGRWWTPDPAGLAAVDPGVVSAVGHTGATAQGLEEPTDTSAAGALSTGLTVSGFIPGLEQAAAIGSIIMDAHKTAKAIGQCP